MEVTDEMLMALADGELDAPTAERLCALVARDPGLQRQLAVFTDSADLLRGAMAPGPVPDRLVRTILAAPVGTAANVVPMAASQSGYRPGYGPAYRPMAAAAMVAGLAFGLGGFLLGQRGADLPAVPAGFAALATGQDLGLGDGTLLRVLGSYETDQGLCRMVSVEGAALQERRILCRGAEGWDMAFRIEAPARGGFLPASDALGGAADLWLDSVGAGAALDPATEAGALGSR